MNQTEKCHRISDVSRTFILRVWRERREIPGAQPVFRGEIENVANGESKHVKNKEEIFDFLTTQLKEIGLMFE